MNHDLFSGMAKGGRVRGMVDVGEREGTENSKSVFKNRSLCARMSSQIHSPNITGPMV